MKRFLALLLSLTMILLFVAGCSSDNDSGQTDTTNPSKEASDKEAVIKVWCWDPNFNIYAMDEAAKIYAKINSKAKIDIIETPWDDVQTKLTTALTSGQTGTLPDILLMQDNALIKNVTNYPDAFVDLTDSGIDFSKFAEYKIALSTVKGKNYGVPFDSGVVINALRTDILEEAGYSIDDMTDITWSEYIDIGKEVLEKTKKPLDSTTAGQPDLLMLMLQSAGSWMFDDSGEVFIKDNDVLKEIIDVYVELVKSGVIVEVNDWDQYVSSFNSGTVAGTINGCWIIGSIVPQTDQKGLWQITNIPKLEKAPNATNYSNQGGSSWMVLSSSKNIDTAIDFLSQTFAGSVELYETILPSSGAIATYLPAGDSDVYSEPHEFFGGQKIYSDIIDFAAKVPKVTYGIYNYEARDAIGNAITKIILGADRDDALNEAEEAVKFQMGK
ncbi:MAG: extracellular solute-binding protein [Xylanivirga thermophila]|uniref:ABC transporter substrate-binding protein n=1 Tax=Xylanivirga thermophila TaxID=2496273 RepID=UPI00101DFFC1|nr:extracellular solute-binding protein [Xylanivirga thermophila]